jgi:hypothetical protein
MGHSENNDRASKSGAQHRQIVVAAGAPRVRAVRGIPLDGGEVEAELAEGGRQAETLGQPNSPSARLVRPPKPIARLIAA